MATRGRGDVDDVVADGVGHLHLFDRVLHGHQRAPVDDLIQPDGFLTPALAPVQHAPLVVPARVADGDPQQEAVELGLGQGVGALVVDRVLRGQDHERSLQPVGLPVDGDLVLGHGLQQRGLGLGRRAVDLVAQDEVGEDRPRPELHRPIRIEHRRPGHVRRQHVGRELDAGEDQAGGLGHAPGHERLGHTRDVLDQHVAVGQHPHEHQFEHRPLPHDHLLDAVEHGRGVVSQVLQGHGHRSSNWSTSSPSSAAVTPGALRSAGSGRSGRIRSHSGWGTR